MIRRDAIKSLGILTAGIVSGATLIAEVAEPKRVCGGLYYYIKHHGYDVGPIPEDIKDIIGDWQNDLTH